MKFRRPGLPKLYPAVINYLEQRQKEFDQITDARRVALAQISTFIAKSAKKKQPAELTFICTHNSRRSHLSQIWAQAIATLLDLSMVRSYSGGTEATAFNPRAIAALQRAGMIIRQLDESANPQYLVGFSPDQQSMRCYSKIFDAPDNPQKNYLAVMTCSEADEACPIVNGAAAKLSLPFIDPKEADGSPLEAQTYDERCRQIAREMLWALQNVTQ